MTHDSRRYHRARRPPFARAYGALGAIGGALEGAGSAVAGGLESAASSALGGAGSSALGALGSIGEGLQSLFSGGGAAGAGAGGEAGYLASLGQAAPAGVELVGPSSTFTGPGFLGSVMQGFASGPQSFANPSAGTSLGQGVGGLLSVLEQIHGRGGGGGMQAGPIVRGIAQQLQGPQVIPGGSAQPATGPIMKLLGIL